MTTPAANVKKLSPRVKRAIGLYATNATRTQKEASALVGCHPQYLTIMLNSNPLAQAELKRVMTDVDIATVDMGVLLHKLSVAAVGRIEEAMYTASSEALRLKAAQDLADRGPQTTKIQRHHVEAFSISGDDVKSIAAAMVESARIRQANSHLAIGSHDATGVSTPQEADVEFPGG